MTKTSWQSKESYNKRAYRRFYFQIDLGIGEEFAACAADRGQSMNHLVEEFMKLYVNDTSLQILLERNPKR